MVLKASDILIHLALMTTLELSSIILSIGISNLLKIIVAELGFGLRQFGFRATFFTIMLCYLDKQIIDSPKLELQ